MGCVAAMDSAGVGLARAGVSSMSIMSSLSSATSSSCSLSEEMMVALALWKPGLAADGFDLLAGAARDAAAADACAGALTGRGGLN